MFQGHQKCCFLVCFCFCFVLLSCKLLREDLGELVSMMECDPDCSMKTLYELCESRLCKGIGEEILEERRDEEWRSIFDVGRRKQGG